MENLDLLGLGFVSFFIGFVVGRYRGYHSGYLEGKKDMFNRMQEET